MHLQTVHEQEGQETALDAGKQRSESILQAFNTGK